jgi:lipid II:glycine glycyltransferase (peptidoglycan interpeptide bridge formation enzyme)
VDKVVRSSIKGVILVVMKNSKVKEDIGRLTDIRQSPAYGKFMEELGWEQVIIGGLRLFVRKIPLFGSVIRIPRANLPLPLEEIDRLARQRKASVVKVEPNLLLDKFNPKSIGTFQKDSQPVLPTRTIWIELKYPIEQVWASLNKDTRNLVRRSEKEGVEVTESKDLANFYKLWRDTAKRKGFYVPFENEMTSLWKSFDEKCLLVARHRSQVVAAVMVFGYNEGAYYYFAASNEDGRKVYAAYLTMWEAIRKSKEMGYERLDLEGIVDSQVRRTKGWQGFSHFKKGFGGKEIHYAGSFSKYYSLFGKLIGRYV